MSAWEWFKAIAFLIASIRIWFYGDLRFLTIIILVAS